MRKRSLMGFFFFWLQMGTGMRPGGQASGFGCIRVGHERKERESGVFW